MCSASLLATEPGPAGHLGPLPASVPRYAENSDPIETAHCPEEVNATLFLLPVCEGGQEKKRLWLCLNSPPKTWEMHRDRNIPERSTGRPVDILQINQQSGESVTRRERSRCCPVGTHLATELGHAPLCLQVESHPREGLLSTAGPASSSMYRVLLCPGHPSQGKAAVLGSSQGLAWCLPCPLPAALCPPLVPLPHRTQHFCKGQRRCIELQVLEGCAGGWPR